MGIKDFFKKKEKIRPINEIDSEIDTLKKKIESLETEKDSAAYLQDWSSTEQTSGYIQRVSYKTLLSLYKKESWVRACVDVIKRTTTANGVRLVNLNEDGQQPQNFDKVASFLHHPNPQETFTELLGGVVVDLEIYGDAYLEIVFDEQGFPKELYNLYTPQMRVVVDEHGTVLGYVLKHNWDKNKTVTWKPHEIIHFRLNNPENEIYGLSPLESLFIPIETDLYAQAYNKNFFKNNATPRGHLDLGNCSRAQVMRNRQYWKSNVQGVNNSHKTIITEGGAKYTSVGTPPKDMEFLEQRKFNRDEILAVYGVPPGKVCVFETANRANSKEQDSSFKKETILPLQRMISDKINRVLMPHFKSPGTKFAFREIDLRDESDQAEIDEVYLEAGVYTINEIRARKGLKPVEWGNKPFTLKSTDITEKSKEQVVEQPTEKEKDNLSDIKEQINQIINGSSEEEEEIEKTDE